MPDFIVVSDFTIPAGNGAQQRFIQDTPLGECTVTRILVTFPAGCSGLVNVALFAGKSPAYPSDQDSFFAFDDYTYVIEVKNQITSGQWQVGGFNLDSFDHTVQVIYECDNLSISPSFASSPPVSI